MAGHRRGERMARRTSCHDRDAADAGPIHTARNAQALTPMSDPTGVGGPQAATPRGPFPVAHSVLRFAAVVLTLATGLTMTPFGCVLPLAPTFDNPPEPQNYPPQITMMEPPAVFIVPGDLAVTVTDPNVGDDLYLRWIAEYPPYSPNSHLLRDDTKIPHSADGSQLLETRPFTNLSCLSLTQGLIYHPVTALVTDRPFPDPMGLTSREDQLTKIDKDAGEAQAHWVINVNCQ